MHSVGNRPTGVRTENLPPICGSTSREAIPSSRAISPEHAFLGIGRYDNTAPKILLAKSLFQEVGDYQNWASVSTVPPDLLMTLNAVDLRSRGSDEPRHSGWVDIIGNYHFAAAYFMIIEHRLLYSPCPER